MKEIILTRGKVALVDDEDFERLNKFKWCVIRPGYVFYAVRAKRVNGKTVFFMMHRDILGITSRFIDADHRDGDGLNNTRDNLRVCSRSQNMANTVKRRGCFTSRYKGVCYFKYGKRKKRWKSEITVDGRSKCLGYFRNEEEAAIAYNNAAEKHFKEFYHGNEVLAVAADK